MKPVKRTLTLALSLILMVTACAVTAMADSTDTTPWGLDKSETYLIKVMGTPSDAWEFYSQTQIGQIILDKFNIDFEYIPYTGTFEEKQQLLLAGGDYYELQSIGKLSILEEYIDAGAVIPLEEYMDRMPNFNKLFSKSIPYWRASGNGTLYFWQGDNSYEASEYYSDNGLSVRADALELYAEKYGWDNPPLYASDWLELLQLAIDAGLTDINGKPAAGLTAPFAEAWGFPGIATAFMETNSIYGPMTFERALWFNFADEKWEDMVSAPMAKDQYRWFNELYKRGLLDEEAATDLYTQTVDKSLTASFIVAYYCGGWFADTTNASLREAGHPEKQYVRMSIFPDTNTPKDGNKFNGVIRYTANNDNMVITTNARYPERILELLDYVCSEEGMNLAANGIQGVHWDYDGDGLRQYIDEDFIRRTRTDDPTYDREYSSTTGISTLFSLIGIMPRVYASDGYPIDITYSKYHREKWRDMDYLPNQIYDKYGWSSSVDFFMDNLNPFWSDYTSVAFEAGSVYADIVQSMADVRARNTWDIWTAEDFDAAWDKMAEEYYALDPQKVVDEQNRLMHEYLETIRPGE